MPQMKILPEMNMTRLIWMTITIKVVVIESEMIQIMILRIRDHTIKLVVTFNLIIPIL